MKEESINSFNELMNLDDMIYYYHVTNSDVDSILQNGLYMVEDKIYTTAIEVPIELKNNPIEYANNEQGMGYRKNANIVIIGIEKEYIDELIKPTTYIPDGWTHDIPPSYYIPSCYIAGYIDVENKDFVLNENFNNIYDLGL